MERQAGDRPEEVRVEGEVFVGAVGGSNDLDQPRRNDCRPDCTQDDLILKAEDREEFRRIVDSIGLKQANAKTVNSLNEAWEFQKQIGLPAIIRPAFTLGGIGGGIAEGTGAGPIARRRRCRRAGSRSGTRRRASRRRV